LAQLFFGKRVRIFHASSSPASFMPTARPSAKPWSTTQVAPSQFPYLCSIERPRLQQLALNQLASGVLIESYEQTQPQCSCGSPLCQHMYVRTSKNVRRPLVRSERRKNGNA